MRPPLLSVFPIWSKPYGLSYGQWSAKWWQWLLSTPKSKNPAYDSSGTNANVNQRDPNVLFLCQTIDSTEQARICQDRSITMKTGKAVFMPIINWISVLYVDGSTDEELVSVAKKKMDVVSELVVELDGVAIKDGLEQYRVRSPFFDAEVSEDNILSLSSGSRHFVADGYWIFLKPLKKDTKLRTFGSCSSGVNKFEINYEINLV